MRQEWVWDGGQLCVTLVNTLRRRGRYGEELLRTPADLAEWLTLADVLPEPTKVTDSHLLAARELREAVDRSVRARAEGEPVGRGDIRVINRFAWANRQAPPQLRLDADGVLRAYRAAPADPVAVALGTIAVDAIALLAQEQPAAVRVCAAPGCGNRFVDRSPAGDRRWCSLTRCASRARPTPRASRAAAGTPRRAAG